MTAVTVLIPTRDRPPALAVTLVALALQREASFSVVVSNQGDRRALEASHPVQCALRLLGLHNHNVLVLDNFPVRGMAQQRQFLLDQVATPYCLFLDDDVILETFVVAMLERILSREGCGFVGNPLIGLSFRDDYRPREEQISFWEGPVWPEAVLPDTPAWYRHRLHNAANCLHVQERLGITPDKPRRYKIAWIGGCVLYDAEKLRGCGGFSFWRELPLEHSGEDVLAQLRVMKRYGGCGVLPSGAYHQELPTTITERGADAQLCLPT